MRIAIANLELLALAGMIIKGQLMNATHRSAIGILSFAAHVHWPWQEVRTVKVQRFYRPEDISRDLGYRSGFWDIYASTEEEVVDVGNIQHKCQVQRSGSLAGWRQHLQICAIPFLLCIDPVPPTTIFRSAQQLLFAVHHQL